MPEKVLLAGVSGRLGSHLLPILKAHGYFVRGISRFPNKTGSNAICDELLTADLCQPSSLQHCCDDIDVVFSSAGASLNPNALTDRASYHAVDYLGNLNLLREAKTAGVKRFVYVSVFGGPAHRHLAYCDTHERFADELANSGLSFCVIRPTGFFGVFQQMFDMAVTGFGITIGDGSCRSNPIHEEDLATICFQALSGDQPHIDVGGPQIITRRDIVTLAFDALGKKPRLAAIPPLFFSGAAAALALPQPRIAALLRFGIEVSLKDTIAPAFGSRRLEDYYRQLAVDGRR